MMTLSPRDALELGWSIIPIRKDKLPYFSLLPRDETGKPIWKPFQTRQPTPEEVEVWEKASPPSYAFVTGVINHTITFDFDGTAGLALAKQWNIQPHRQTGSGGFHWDVNHPGWYVPTLNGKAKQELGRRWPGLDVKGDGGYAIFTGSNAKGSYTWLRPPGPDPPELVPEEVWAFLKAKKQSAADESQGGAAEKNEPVTEARTIQATRETQRVSEDVLIRRALALQSSDGRNNVGFWLAVQLRDNGYSFSEAASALHSYQSRSKTTNAKGEPEPYTSAEVSASLREAYRAAPREPWGVGNRTWTNSSWTRQAEYPDTQPDAQPAIPQELQKLYAPDGLQLTAVGNSERFLRDYREDVCWVEGPTRLSAGTFYCWDGQRWAMGDTPAVLLARKTIADLRTLISQAAQDNRDSDTIKALVSFWRSSESNHKIEEILALARWNLVIEQGKFDADPDLLGVRNGVVDLRTGQLREARRGDYITKQCNVVFDAAATCPVWEQFLLDTTKIDYALIAYLQQCVGISLTGHTKEHLFFIVVGPGGTGKTTFFETVKYMLGNYAIGIDPNSLAASLKAEGGRARPDIARLPGVRMAFANEAREGLRLDAGLVKALTGGDTVQARHLYLAEFDFIPTHKLWLRTNKEPQFDGADSGMQRRVRKIPFTQIVKDSKPEDRNLPEKLRGEAAGILNWAISGLLSYQQHGLIEPTIVQTQTAEYIKSLDIMGQFIDEECDIGAFLQPAKTMYERYRNWIEARGQLPISIQRFKTSLQEKGYSQSSTKVANCWEGIRLKLAEYEESTT